MRNKRYTKQSGKLKNSLRFSLGVAAASATMLILLLVVMFNLSRQEDSHAGSPMVFVGADTMQDTSFVFRGSANQQGLGIVVQTSGTSSPLKISSIEFKAECSVGINADNIENARLWYTGTDPEFACIAQTGATLTEIGEGKFSIEVNKVLLAGMNYFWLTFDVKQEANSPAYFDVSCTGIRAGALNYLPFLSSPDGRRLIAGNSAYYSQGDLLVNHVDSWNSKRDGSGEKPKQIGNERNAYFIQSGHHMQNVRSSSMSSITIENGGTLKALATLKLKRLKVETNAIYEQVSPVTDFYCIDHFEVANNGTYIHNNTGYVPGLHCDFKPQSTQQFLQYGQATFPYTVTWGNVYIASSSRINFDIQKNFRNVKGNLEFHRTGENNYLYCDGTDTMEIGGNLIFSGGSFTGVTGKGHILTLIVKGSLMMNDGTFTDAEAIGTHLSHSILNICGDISFTGGMFDYAQCDDRGSVINLTGGNSVSKWEQSGGEILLGNVRIDAHKTVTVSGPLFGAVAADRSFVVASEGTLMCGTSQLAGPGTFILEDKSTLGIGHPEGISSIGNEGNIITKLRVYNSGASYTYYMNSNPQKTGRFTTEPWSGTVRTLTVKKDASSHWVILSQDMMVSDHIVISKGIVEKNSKKLLKTDLSQEEYARTERLATAGK